VENPHWNRDSQISFPLAFERGFNLGFAVPRENEYPSAITLANGISPMQYGDEIAKIVARYAVSLSRKKPACGGRTGDDSLVIALNLLGHDAHCVFVRREVATRSRGIDLCELSAEKEDLR
jgi:hypothetical protein